MKIYKIAYQVVNPNINTNCSVVFSVITNKPYF